jgi:predicted nuclease with TOPRIM domain
MKKFTKHVIAKGFEMGLMNASKKIMKKYPIEQIAEEFNQKITEAVNEVKIACEEVQKELDEVQKNLEEAQNKLDEKDKELEVLKSENNRLSNKLSSIEPVHYMTSDDWIMKEVSFWSGGILLLLFVIILTTILKYV